MADKHSKTKLVQLGRSPKDFHGAVNTPTYQTSTILFPTLKDWLAAEKGTACYEKIGSDSVDFSYGLSGMPTSLSLAQTICEFEHGHHCVLTSSGLSAITVAMMAVLATGDHVLMSDAVYGPTRRLCENQLKKLGIEVTYYDPTIGGDIESLVQPNTKLIFLESPGSQLFEVQDLEAITAVAKKHGAITMLDNSWGSPLFLRPLEWGVDISVLAVTKFISGHSDVVMGAIVTNEATTSTIMKACRNMGVAGNAHDASLALRGIRTTEVRLDYQQKSVMKVVEAVKKHPKVKRVFFPADPESESYGLWQKYFDGVASLFSIETHEEYDLDAKSQMLDPMSCFGIGVSWGGYESLVTTFDPNLMRSATRAKWANGGSFFRFYVGLEETQDLIDDILDALDRL